VALVLDDNVQRLLVILADALWGKGGRDEAADTQWSAHYMKCADV
jgi:hypothetical protein